jgi:phosphatidylserine decarboxylase
VREPLDIPEGFNHNPSIIFREIVCNGAGIATDPDRHKKKSRSFMSIRAEVWPFVAIAALVAVLVALLLGKCTPLGLSKSICVAAVILSVFEGYFFWFFRNPTRVAPKEPDVIVAAADGVVAKITTFSVDQFDSISMLAGLKPEDMQAFRQGEVLRISIFLSLFDVHVNRVPISGNSRFLGYFPGKHMFTFDEKSSDVNQHNSILIANDRTHCLVNQIVGPICRRVVYWLDHDASVPVEKGDDFGMMKFGSRLDMYFPANDIEVLVSEETRVRAGESIIARYR